MPSFAQHAGASSNFDLIPNGVLLWAYLSIREYKTSPKTGTKYLDVELTIDDNQPFARKKLWTNIMDPLFEGNSDGAKQMGATAITRILECRGANPGNPKGYEIDPPYQGLSGSRVAIKVKVIEEKDGYPAKNDVAEWLTPNPASQSGNKGYAKLMQGDHNLPAAKPGPAHGGFALPPSQSPAQAAPAATAPAWGQPKTATPPPQNPNNPPSWLDQTQRT